MARSSWACGADDFPYALLSDIFCETTAAYFLGAPLLSSVACLPAKAHCPAAAVSCFGSRLGRKAQAALIRAP